MPWKDSMSEKLYFVEAMQHTTNFSELCRAYGISRETGYKWKRRYEEGGVEALEELSRRPHNSPGETSEVLQAVILEEKLRHRGWGSKKILDRLHRGPEDPPGPLPAPPGRLGAPHPRLSSPPAANCGELEARPLPCREAPGRPRPEPLAPPLPGLNA